MYLSKAGARDIPGVLVFSESDPLPGKPPTDSSEAAGGLGDEAAEPGVRGVVLVLAVLPQRLGDGLEPARALEQQLAQRHEQVQVEISQVSDGTRHGATI